MIAWRHLRAVRVKLQVPCDFAQGRISLTRSCRDDKVEAGPTLARLDVDGQSRNAESVLFVFRFCYETDFCGTGLDGEVQLSSLVPSDSCSEGMDGGFFCRVSCWLVDHVFVDLGVL